MASITDYIQAGSAIATGILAIITYLQGRKIKTLSHVVDEMSKQTRLLAASYLLEEELSKKDRFPVINLIKKTIDKTTIPSVFHFHLVNEGQDAHNVTIISHNPHQFTFTFGAEETGFGALFQRKSSGVVRVHIPAGHAEFSGDLIYETNDGQKYKQPFGYHQEKLTLSLAQRIRPEKANFKLKS